MPTLKEIAEKADVSVSVVSRVLNANPDKNARVAKKTREHIRKIAEKLGYRHNRAAEFLKRGKIPALGVFLPKMANRLIADLVIGISEAAAEKGFPLNFDFEMTQQAYQRFIKSNIGQAHCGLITYPIFKTGNKITQMLEDFRAGGGNIVVLNTDNHPEEITSVAMDEFTGGKLAGERLVAKTCDSFILLGSYPGRDEGFEKAIGKHAVKMKKFNAEEENIKELSSHLKKCRGKKTGIFAVTDMYALRAYRAAQAADMKVGEDVYVIGYDDLHLMDEVSPPLSTIHQPFREEGRIAVEKLVNIIYGQEEKNELVTPIFVERTSG